MNSDRIIEILEETAYKDGEKLKGFSCYLTQHAWDLAEKFLLAELKFKHEKN